MAERVCSWTQHSGEIDAVNNCHLKQRRLRFKIGAKVKNKCSRIQTPFSNSGDKFCAEIDSSHRIKFRQPFKSCLYQGLDGQLETARIEINQWRHDDQRITSILQTQEKIKNVRQSLGVLCFGKITKNNNGSGHRRFVVFNLRLFVECNHDIAADIAADRDEFL
ncbi:hypothetical protein BDR26DRAFT_901016 [Obelidium mucronatum]|nr:hypothetical protein BDR26DRAFT_901016 [Obelidium mucronatum]